jgi:outer membrane protein OmpA-like peptidoglycan-associated protein
LFGIFFDKEAIDLQIILNRATMKNLAFFVLALFPMLLAGQNGCDFFEFRKIEIEKTNINTTQSDFGPAFVNNELWYSAFSNEEIEKLTKGKSKNTYYNLYSIITDELGNVTGSKKNEFEDISAGYHAGPVSYCDKTKELFVTINNYENPEVRNSVYQKADIRLKIIIAVQENGNWKVKEEIPFNDSTYSVGHPAISVTGDTLFFASDKPGGYGGSDIYMSVRNEGKWQNPINVGTSINTSADEMFPFLLGGTNLFYASNKEENEQSDFDLMHVCLNSDGSFDNPVPLDAFNSDEDDFGLVIHPELKVGYFVSRRVGGMGDDDIYKVKFTGEYNLELIVMDKKTMLPFMNPVVQFSDNIVAKVADVLLSRPIQENTTLTVSTNYEGYMNTSKQISTEGKAPGIIRDTLWIEKVEVKQIFVMDNIYYNFDKWDILPESEIELGKLIKVMNDNPSWKVELGSHTDSRGSDSYNMKLSQRRSDSAVAYIVENGIDKERIVAKGYGESQLVNQCANGVKCGAEEHRQNRRTEFKILEMDGK